MEKVGLPIKTKVVAWWMIVFAMINLATDILGTLGLISSYGFGFGPPTLGALIYVFLLLTKYLVIFGSVILIFKKRRVGWWMALIILGLSSAQTMIVKSSFVTDFFFFSEIPFILLILDRKNFWKIAK